jgi:hypothetical protein
MAAAERRATYYHVGPRHELKCACSSYPLLSSVYFTIYSARVRLLHKPTWLVFDVGGVLLDWPSSSAAIAKYLCITHDELFNALFDQSVKVGIGARINIGSLPLKQSGS